MADDKGKNKKKWYEFSDKEKRGGLGLLLLLLAISAVQNRVAIARAYARWTAPTITIATFTKDVQDGKVREVEITPTREGHECRFDIVAKDGRAYIAHGMGQTCRDLSDQLEKDRRLRVWFQPSEGSGTKTGSTSDLVSSLFNWGILLFLMYQIFRRYKGDKIEPFVPSKEAPVTFADVGGIDEARDDLEEIVKRLKDPESLLKLGGLPLRGALLIGPPGTGKTLLARAVAGEADVPFFLVTGPSLSEGHVGESAKRIHELFETARRVAPAIIFIDEIDAIGRSRTINDPPNWDQPGLNQLLVEMDGVDGRQGVVVLAATNHPELLDTALTRAGRFDRKVTLQLPDAKGRLAILEKTVRSRKISLASAVNLEDVARSTPGFSGAELAGLLNEAVLGAVRAARGEVTGQDLDAARDRVLMGSATARALTPHELRVVATHEAGHAIVAYHLPHAQPIHKVTIVHRGAALGMVMQTPHEDRYLMMRVELIASIAMMLGGRLAEERTFNEFHVTTGAASDFQQATTLATRMVREWGMVSQAEGDWCRERTYAASDRLSDALHQEVERQVAKILAEARQLAEETLKKHDIHHKRLVAALLARETLTREDLDTLFADPEPAPAEPPQA